MCVSSWVCLGTVVGGSWLMCVCVCVCLFVLFVLFVCVLCVCLVLRIGLVWHGGRGVCVWAWMR